MGRQRHDTDRTAEARADALASVVEDLAGKFTLRPLLDRILRRSVELLGCDAGSISSVDEAAGVYRKEADFGIACQSGRSFPLTEGMTGAVVAARAPLIFKEYADVPGGHVAPGDRATLHGVIGVPIGWRDRVIGACVVFSRDPERTFTDDDARLLELFAKHAAIAIVNARMHEQLEERTRAEATAAERERLVREVHDSVAQGLAAVLVHLEGATGPDGAQLAAAREAARGALAESRRTALGLAPSLLEGHSLEEAIGVEVAWARATGNLDAKLVVAGQPAPLTPELAHQAFRIVQEALTNIVQHAAASSARVGVVYGPDGLVLMVQDDGRGFDRSSEPGSEPGPGGYGLRGIVARARTYGGGVDVESTPGWGTRIRASLPYQPAESADPAGSRLRVLVVDDQPVARAGLARLLAAAEPGVQVVAEIDSAPALLDAYRLLRPDVVLVDAYLSEHDGVECTRRLVAEDPGAAVVLLGATAGDPVVAQALRAGARGCVGPDADGPELARAVLAAAHGGITLSAGGRTAPPRPDGPAADGAALTVREREVRDLLERGLRDKQIAERLSISVKTVEKHVGAVLRKTGASSRTEVAARAAR